MTHVQLTTLKALKEKGPHLISAPNAARMSDKGWVEKTGQPGARGLAHVTITAAGTEALARQPA